MSRLRIQRAESGIVFVSSTTFQRRPIFRDPLTAELFLFVLRSYEKRGNFSMHAFCIMRDHYHLVLEIQKLTPLSRILNSVHSYFVECLPRLPSGRKQRIWARYSWDVWIRDEAMYWQKVAYTLLNPLRAGLVDHPLDPYPFSDILAWRKKHGDAFMLDLFGRNARWNE